MKDSKGIGFKEYIVKLKKYLETVASKIIEKTKKHIKTQDKEKKAKNVMNAYKFFAFVTYILVFFMVLYVAINVFGGFFGYNVYVITSDSMSPEIKKGDVVISKKFLQEELKIKDVITYKRDDEYITHRIYEIKEENSVMTYVTRGDNNAVNDVDYVSFYEITGIKVGKIPLIGFLMIGALEPEIIIILLIIFIILYERAKAIDIRKIERRKIKKIEEIKNK